MSTKSNQTRGTGSASKGKMTAKQREAKKRRKIIIFSVEILVILLMVGVIYTIYAKGSDGPVVVDIPEEKLHIDEAVDKNETMQGYWNIALFGVDATTDSELFKGSRSDSTMIASINMDTGDIKLVSVYRDTYLNVGNDKYNKCNAAYSYGGAEQALKMLNTNLDMDIKDFVTVGYEGLSKVIDGLGGVTIDVNEAELQHINNYQISIVRDVKALGKEKIVNVTKTGEQTLNGMQASAYCRIRYGGGDDYQRTARQREVLKAIEAKAKQTDLATLTKVFNDATENIYTSLKAEDIIKLLGKIADYRIVGEDGFPQEKMRTTANVGSAGSVIIPMDLESNVVWLHQYLFDDQTYEVTDTVREYGAVINKKTSSYVGN